MPATALGTGVPNTGFGANKHAVGYFSHLNDAEAAVNDLRSAGFPLSQISLFHRDLSRREPFAGVNITDRFDPIRLGLPDARARFYNDRVNHGDYVVVVSGTDDEIHRAAAILSRHGIQEWEIYDPTVVSSTQPGVIAAPLQRNRRAIGVFPHRRDAEAALSDLRDAGFPLSQVSLIAKDADGTHNIAGTGVNVNPDAAKGNKADDGAKAGAATGGALGGLGGLLVGLGALAIPGVGPVIAGGAVATALATTLAGGAIGAAAGGLAGGLVGLGIPENRAKVYSDRINRGDYLVIVDGTEDEVRRAEPILKRHGIQEFDIFDAADTHGVHHSGVHHSGVHSGVGTAPVQRNRRAIGVFPHRRDAEAALTDLRDAGFPLSQVSLIAKDADGTHNIAGSGVNVNPAAAKGNKADEGAKAGAATGGALGGLGGLLVGLGALAIPGVGPILAGGAVATALATTLAGGAIGAAAGGLAGGLVGLGIPENRAKVYSDRINRGDYLVIVDGTEDEVRRAEPILKRHGIQEFDIFDAADTHGVHHPDHDRGVRHQTAVVNTTPNEIPVVNTTFNETPVVHGTSTNYSSGYDENDPAVIIVDRRDETI
ncbi:hypothetical protein NIES2130_06170 [Scytonema sp. HK-05]|nr:hypothetical protein NIES2130_06170 [Scytonema sp. HK-05]